MTHHIDLDLGRESTGRVSLDGEDIAERLNGVIVMARLGEPTQVDLLLVAPTVEAHVEGAVLWSHFGCQHCRGHEERP